MVFGGSRGPGWRYGPCEQRQDDLCRSQERGERKVEVVIMRDMVLASGPLQYSVRFKGTEFGGVEVWPGEGGGHFP